MNSPHGGSPRPVGALGHVPWFGAPRAVRLVNQFIHEAVDLVERLVKPGSRHAGCAGLKGGFERGHIFISDVARWCEMRHVSSSTTATAVAVLRDSESPMPCHNSLPALLVSSSFKLSLCRPRVYLHVSYEVNRMLHRGA